MTEASEDLSKKIISSQERLIEERKVFFNRIIEYLKMKPTSVDFYLLQGHHFQEIDEKEANINAELGDFWLPVNTMINKYELSFVYSIWQFGNILKIGLIGYNNSECPIPGLWDSCRKDIETMWHKVPDNFVNNKKNEDISDQENLIERKKGKYSRNNIQDRYDTAQSNHINDKTKIIPEFIERDKKLFCEWTFDATNLYESYQNQEYFILGFRHMHCRNISILNQKIKDYINQNE